MKNSASDTDASHLITQLKKGDNQAFEAIFKLYYPALLHFSRNYLLNTADAEGVVQNIFMKLWERREKLDENIKLTNYLYTMCKNACLDQLKHKKVKNKYALNERNKYNMHTQFIKDEAAYPLLEKELEKHILKSIELLPSKCKAVFIKSRYEGLNYKEIAKELGISKKTVEGHITNALSHMRVQLKDFLSIFL